MDKEEVAWIQSKLKDIVKRKKQSYRKIAERLDCSEITIKRFFTSDDLSFAKLKEICEVLDIHVFDFLHSVSDRKAQTYSLTEEQEQYFCQHMDCYYFFSSVSEDTSEEDIATKLNLTRARIHQYFRQLEKLNLVQPRLNGNYRFLNSGSLTWLRGGPLQRQFMDRRHTQYVKCFSKKLENPNCFLTSTEGRLSASSIQEMARDMAFLREKYGNRAHIEQLSHLDSELIGVAWLMGVSPFKRNLRQYFDDKKL